MTAGLHLPPGQMEGGIILPELEIPLKKLSEGPSLKCCISFP